MNKAEYISNAKEKLEKVILSNSANEKDKAIAKMIIEEVMGDIQFEQERLEESIKNAEMINKKRTTENENDDKKMVDLIRELEIKELRIIDLKNDNDNYEEQLNKLKSSYSKAQHVWDTERKSILPKLEKLEKESAQKSKIIEDNKAKLNMYEFDNVDLKETAERYLKKFSKLQKQFNELNSYNVESFKLQSENEGLKKKIADLEDYYEKQEQRQIDKMNQLIHENDNLREECKSVKEKMKKIEEDKWKFNFNTDINENLLDNSYIKDSKLALTKNVPSNINKISNSNTPYIKGSTFSFNDDNRSIGDEKLIIDRLESFNHIKQNQSNTSFELNKLINQSVDNINKPIMIDLSVQTDRKEHMNVSVGFNEFLSTQVERRNYTITDVLMNKMMKRYKIKMIDTNTQTNTVNCEVGINCNLDLEIRQKKPKPSVKPLFKVLLSNKRCSQLSLSKNVYSGLPKHRYGKDIHKIETVLNETLSCCKQLVEPQLCISSPHSLIKQNRVSSSLQISHLFDQTLIESRSELKEEDLIEKVVEIKKINKACLTTKNMLNKDLTTEIGRNYSVSYGNTKCFNTIEYSIFNKEKIQSIYQNTQYQLINKKKVNKKLHSSENYFFCFEKIIQKINYMKEVNFASLLQKRDFEHENRIVTLENHIKHLKEDREAQILDKDNKINHLIQELENQNEKARQTLNETETQLKSEHEEKMSEMIKNKYDQLNKLNEQLTEKEDEIKRINRDRIGLQAKLDELEKKIQDRGETSNNAYQTTLELQNEINKLKQKISLLNEKERENKERLTQKHMIEINSLKAENESFVNKLNELINQNEILRVKSQKHDENQLLVSVLQNDLQVEKLKSRKNFEQIKILQEAKRKQDNKMIELQMHSHDLEAKLEESTSMGKNLVQSNISSFGDFELLAVKEENKKLMKEKDELNNTVKELRRSQMKLSNYSASQFQLSGCKSQRSFNKFGSFSKNTLQIPSQNSDLINNQGSKKKFKLSIWDDNRDNTRFASLKSENNLFENRKPSPKPVEPQKNEVKIAKINKILKNKKKEGNDEFVEQAKFYSYDYICLGERAELIGTIRKYHSCRDARKWFADIVYRVNSWTNKKKKFIIITDNSIFLFNNDNSLKYVFALNEIRKLKHNPKNNYIGIERIGSKDDEIIETFRKEELILFLKKKINNLGWILKIVESDLFEKKNKLNDEVTYNPNMMKKFKPHFTQTFSLASRKKRLCFISTKNKDFFSLDDKKELLCLLTNFGIIGFTKKEFKINLFIPLVGSLVKSDRNYNQRLYIKLCDNSIKTLIFNNINDKNSWFEMIDKTINKLKEIENN